jgi:kynurenine formamidase
MDARRTRGFVVETPVNFASDRNLSRQIALHGNYVVERSARLTAVPETGSLIIVAPAKNGTGGDTPVRVLALVTR